MECFEINDENFKIVESIIRTIITKSTKIIESDNFKDLPVKSMLSVITWILENIQTETLNFYLHHVEITYDYDRDVKEILYNCMVSVIAKQSPGKYEKYVDDK